MSRTKTDKARMVELDSVTALRTLRAKQAQERLFAGAGYQDNDLIFCRPDGRPYHPEVLQVLRPTPRPACLCRALAHPAPRSSPHAWTTLALTAGVDVAIVSKRLGNSSPTVTWCTY
jgi:hypothetical protein